MVAAAAEVASGYPESCRTAGEVLLRWYMVSRDRDGDVRGGGGSRGGCRAA